MKEQKEREETEMVRAAEATELFLNKLLNPNVVNISEIIEEALKYYDSDLESLGQKFDLAKGEAEYFFSDLFEWDTDVEGSEGGITLVYSFGSGMFYYFYRRYQKQTNKYYIHVYKLEKAALEEMLREGKSLNEVLQEGIAWQLR
jgi:hypothetical protein